jgi:SPP1 gp7 family putative phage head morphogenesis protein
VEATVITGVGPDGDPYRAVLNGREIPVLLVPELLWIYTPDQGEPILSGPAGIEVEFDRDDPAAVYAWLLGHTTVSSIEGPHLLPDIPGDLVDVPKPPAEPAEPAAESVEEADPDPKAGEWPGWERDQATAEHWAGELLTELVDAFSPERVAARWLRSGVVRAAQEAGPEDVPAEAPAEPVPPPVPAAAEWLLGQGVAIQAALVATIPAAITDGYLIGAKAAQAVIDGLDVNWDDWEPGDEDAAAKILGADGRGQGLRELLAESEVRLYEISAARMEAFAKLLAKAVAEGWSVDQLAKELLAFRNDRTWAYTTAQTEIARAISAATLDTYVENDIERHEWSISGPDPKDRVRVCPTCQANAAAGPIKVGAKFPSGEKAPPGHPRCRCALIPVIDFD